MVKSNYIIYLVIALRTAQEIKQRLNFCAENKSLFIFMHDYFSLTRKMRLHWRQYTKKVILDKMGVPFFLTHGALLGAYRDGDWIKWDDDVELDIFDEIFQDYYDKICSALMNDGFVIRGRKIEKRKKPGEKVNLYRYKESISIRGIYTDPNYENDKYRLTNVFQYLRKFHDNPQNIEFKNAVFQAPGPIEDFLEYRYGKDWRTPINLYTSKEAKKANFKTLYERGIRRPGR